MSRAEKIAKMATRTAVQAKENSSVKRKRKKAKNGVLFEAHKHCVECSIPIPLSYDSLICKSISKIEKIAGGCLLYTSDAADE